MWCAIGLFLCNALSGAVGARTEDPAALALPEIKKRLQSKDVVERDKALLDLTVIAAEERDAPRKEVAQVVAYALDDDDLAIRERAARFLAKDFHPEVAVTQLVKSLDEASQEVQKLGRGAFGPRGGGARADQTEEEQTKVKEGQQRLAVLGTIVESLGALRDDRCVEALIDLLRKLPPRSPQQVALPACRSLVKLEARPGIEQVIQHLKSRSGGGGRFGGGGGNDNGNGGRDPGDRGREIHELLEQLARSRKTADIPEFGEQVGEAWSRWLEKHSKQFDVKIGRVHAPKAD